MDTDQSGAQVIKVGSNAVSSYPSAVQSNKDSVTISLNSLGLGSSDMPLLDEHYENIEDNSFENKLLNPIDASSQSQKESQPSVQDNVVIVQSSNSVSEDQKSFELVKKYIQIKNLPGSELAETINKLAYEDQLTSDQVEELFEFLHEREFDYYKNLINSDEIRHSDNGIALWIDESINSESLSPEKAGVLLDLLQDKQFEEFKNLIAELPSEYPVIQLLTEKVESKAVTAEQALELYSTIEAREINLLKLNLSSLKGNSEEIKRLLEEARSHGKISFKTQLELLKEFENL